MNCNQIEDVWTRRELLGKAGGGIGALALASLLHQQGYGAIELGENPLEARKPHFGKQSMLSGSSSTAALPMSIPGITSPSSRNAMVRNWRVSTPPPGFLKMR